LGRQISCLGSLLESAEILALLGGEGKRREAKDQGQCGIGADESHGSSAELD